MNRMQALEVATARYNEMIAARINHLFHNGPSVNEASFGYMHGWVKVGDFIFCSDEMGHPDNQPIMD